LAVVEKLPQLNLLRPIKPKEANQSLIQMLEILPARILTKEAALRAKPNLNRYYNPSFLYTLLS